MISNFPEVSNFNQLFLKLNWFICNYGSPQSLIGFYFCIESQNYPVEENQSYWSYARCPTTTITTTTATIGIVVPYPWFSFPLDR